MARSPSSNPITDPVVGLGSVEAGRAPVSTKPATARRAEVHRADRTFFWTLCLISAGLIVLLGLIGGYLLKGSLPVLERLGVGFVTSSTWDPVREVYGILPVIYGTLVSSAIAVLIAAPLSVGVALFLNELAPKSLARVAGFLVEMLAAIPSVVYGLWGVFVLAPWLRISVEPFLKSWLGFLPLFQGPPYGVGMLAAGIVLAIMITPTITTISREVFASVPRGHREAALALGATRWETLRLAVLKTGKRGIFGAVILGLGRALGETMAVTMVIGNRHAISSSLFAPGQTMASIIANQYAEASSDMQLSSLIGVGFALFLVTFIVNSIARLYIARGFRWGPVGRGKGA